MIDKELTLEEWDDLYEKIDEEFSEERIVEANKYLEREFFRFLYPNKFKERQNRRRDYYQKNKAKIKIKDARRRYREKNVIHDFTKKEWDQKVKDTHEICPVCKLPYEIGFGLTMDHSPPLISVENGFVYTIENVNPMCRSCNSKKGTKI